MKKLIIGIFIFLGALSAFPSFAQKLVIRLNNGNENVEALSTIQKLYFSSGDMVVDFYSGPDDIYGLSDVQKLYFDSTVAVGEIPLADDGGCKVYPNPAGDVITITGINQKDGPVRVYRMDGGLVLQKPFLSPGEGLDVSGLHSGLYLIQAGGSTIKFVKE